MNQEVYPIKDSSPLIEKARDSLEDQRIVAHKLKEANQPIINNRSIG